MELFSLKPYQNKRICVAVSGGADSVCLLHYFYRNAAQSHITLSAVTCEHGIRGEDSLKDLRFVETLCADWEIPLYVFRRNIPESAKRSGRGLEEEGRAFRYECFEKIIEEGRAEFVATAHHRDDFAETVLFRLIRGTSIGGLSAFGRDRIIRPLLAFSRAELMQYQRENALPFVTDASNFDDAYTRNLLRNRVFPLLEKAVHGADGHLVSFALRVGADDEYLRQCAENALTVTEKEVSFSASLPYPVLSRAAVLAMKRLGTEKDYTEKNIEELKKLTDLQSGKRVSLPNGMTACREGGRIVLYRIEERREEMTPFREGVFPFGDFTVVVSAVPDAQALRIDGGRLPENCVLRTRREGDLFTPFRNGQKTLKKFLTDKKIPARIGRTLPLLASGREVLAVFGTEISDKLRVTEQTERVLYLSLRSKDGAPS